MCAAIAGSTILMSCQDGSGCVRGQDQQTRLIILLLHALMSYCTCGRSTAPAVTMTTHCHWHPPAPAMEHASIQSTPTGTQTRTQTHPIIHIQQLKGSTVSELSHEAYLSPPSVFKERTSVTALFISGPNDCKLNIYSTS